MSDVVSGCEGVLSTRPGIAVPDGLVVTVEPRARGRGGDPQEGT